MENALEISPVQLAFILMVNNVSHVLNIVLVVHVKQYVIVVLMGLNFNQWPFMVLRLPIVLKYVEMVEDLNLIVMMVTLKIKMVVHLNAKLKMAIHVKEDQA